MKLFKNLSIKECLVLILLLIFIIVLIKVYMKWRKFANIVDKIPGPVAIPYLGNSLDFFLASSMSLISAFNYLFRVYGPVYRVWIGSMPMIGVKDPDVVEAILNSQINVHKAFGYLFLKPWLGDGLISSIGHKWHSHRKLITPTFHFKMLEQFMVIFQEKANTLVDKLDKKCDNGPFNIHMDITLASLYAICESAMGINFDTKSGADVKFIESILTVTHLVGDRMKCSLLYPDFIFFNTRRGKKFLKCVKTVHEFTMKFIHERKMSKKKTLLKQDSADDLGIKKKHTFLDLLIDSNDVTLNEEMIRDEVATFTFAGHDTLSSTIYFCLFALANNSECQDKVYAELNDIFFDEERKITMEDIGNMKYLERAIKETMRMYSIIPFIGRKIVQEIKVGKYHIPVGAHVVIHMYQMHNDPKVFPNPKVFDPDRFLPDAISNRHTYAFIPFSAGPRNCIGQKYGMLFSKVVLATILRRYKISTVESQKEMRLSMAIVMQPEKHYNIILERRKKQTDLIVN